MVRNVRLRGVLVVVLAASVAGWWLGGSHRAAIREVLVVRALDGDTIVVADRGGEGAEETIRLLGVDTPETHHPRKPVQCFGPEAAAFTQAHLEGRWVRLEDDVERRDIYGRRLAYVYLDGRLFEDTLLTRGYARLLVIEPNHAHARTMLDEELDAQAAARRPVGCLRRRAVNRCADVPMGAARKPGRVTGTSNARLLEGAPHHDPDRNRVRVFPSTLPDPWGGANESSGRHDSSGRPRSP